MNFSSAASLKQTDTITKEVSTTNTNNNEVSIKNTDIHAKDITKYKSAGAPTKLVNGLTRAQIKNGLSRAQKFYNNKHRLPKYVSFGARKIPISIFKKILATQKLRIHTTTAKSASYRNPDTSSIKSLAKSLSVRTTSSYVKAVRIFNWVRDNISYSFYYNTRYGATGTLKSRTANCVDTSHLLIALNRAAGLTAVYRHGTCKFSSGNWYGHVWTRVKIKGKWYAEDATSYRNSLGVIKNWNTKTYKLHGTYTTLPF